jgi:chitinase
MVKRIKLILLLCFVLTVFGQAQYKVIAYYFPRRGDTTTNYPIDKLTHVIFSFLKLQNDTLSFHNDSQKLALKKWVDLKLQYPNLKVMVSLGGWGGCAPCSELFASEEHRNNFAKNVVVLFRQNGIDGIDLDWEYPVIPGYPGHKYDTADKNNFTELVKALRREMKNDFILSFAAGGFTSYLEKSIDWDAVMPQVDFVNLMTYDLVSGYSTTTGHHTLLYDQKEGQESTRRCVDWLLNKNVDPKKLVIGAAFYARVWENVEDVNHGLYQPGKFKQSVSYKNFTTYFADSLGFKYYWDKKAKAPYQYSPSKKLFATFDNKHSIREKAKFVRKEKLGGIMFWELGEDAKEDGLVEEIYHRLNNK